MHLIDQQHQNAISSFSIQENKMEHVFIKAGEDMNWQVFSILHGVLLVTLGKRKSQVCQECCQALAHQLDVIAHCHYQNHLEMLTLTISTMVHFKEVYMAQALLYN